MEENLDGASRADIGIHRCLVFADSDRAEFVQVEQDAVSEKQFAPRMEFSDATYPLTPMAI